MFCDQSPFCKNRNHQQFQLMKLVFSTVFTSHFTQEEIIVKSLFFINRLLYYWLLKNLKLTQQKQTCSSKLNTIRQFNMKTKASLGLTNWSQKSLGFTDFISCVLLLPICLFTGLLDYCFFIDCQFVSHCLFNIHTHPQPFNGPLSASTFTHSHPSWSSDIFYQLSPSNTIHSIRSFQVLKILHMWHLSSESYCLIMCAFM